MEFFFHGKMEGERPTPAARIKPVSTTGTVDGSAQPDSGMEGDFGHIIPQ
jgi:hypothetical protein